MNQFVLFAEIFSYVIFVFCLRHAFKKSYFHVIQLFFGVVFGTLLEWASIEQTGAYSYGKFLVMIDTTPIAVGAAWSAIIYSSMCFSENTLLPWFLKPLLDALLALNIDLAMDTIAIRIGMWTWGDGLGNYYFGVPFCNFWAWFWVVFIFSFLIRVFKKIYPKMNPWLAFSAIAPLCVFFILLTNLIMLQLIDLKLDLIATICTAVIAILVLIIKRDRLLMKEDNDELLTFLVPLSFHCEFLGLGIVSGVIFQPTILLFVSLLMIVVPMFFHRNLLYSQLTKLKLIGLSRN